MKEILIILDNLIEFLSLSLEFMLLTRFNIFLDWAVVAMKVLVAVAAAEAVNLVVPVSVVGVG